MPKVILRLLAKSKSMKISSESHKTSSLGEALIESRTAIKTPPPKLPRDFCSRLKILYFGGKISPSAIELIILREAMIRLASRTCISITIL